MLEDLGAYTDDLDYVFYDVLGDVVCGGFAAPIREGYAEQVLIVTSGEKMALYAANNICQAVKNFEDRGYAHVGGIILNHRNVPGETEKVYAFAKEHGIDVIAEIPRSDDINECEDMGHTAVESRPECEASKSFIELAEKLLGGDK
jgi:nitrogenase iron protein NifH